MMTTGLPLSQRIMTSEQGFEWVRQPRRGLGGRLMPCGGEFLSIYKVLGLSSQPRTRKWKSELVAEVLSIYEVLALNYYRLEPTKTIPDVFFPAGADGWVRQGTPCPPLDTSLGAEFGGSQEGSVASRHDAAELFPRVLVSLSGSRQATKVLALPPWLSGDVVSAGDIICVRGLASMRYGVNPMSTYRHAKHHTWMPVCINHTLPRYPLV